MRTLNDYFVQCGDVAISTTNGTSEIGVAADDGTLIGFWINFDVIMDADTNLDVLVNGVNDDDFHTIPDTTAALTPYWVPYSGTVKNISAGDRIQLRSAGTQVATTTAGVTAIIRR